MPATLLKFARKITKIRFMPFGLLDHCWDDVPVPVSLREKPNIDDLTWHHHQVSGKMQLVLADIHEKLAILEETNCGEMKLGE
ncbi:HNH endonuclease [Bacillus sp. RAR_GA_16]|nr:HNH endonuclease [Bacillus sp. RAR_GA_16]